VQLGILAGLAAVVVLALVTAAWVTWPRSATANPSLGSPGAASPTATSEPSVVLMGAGDICRIAGIRSAARTAALVKAEPSARVFTLGDNSNEFGTAEEFTECYDRTWGAFKDRTRPAAGNHDLLTADGAPYYAYFGSAAGATGKGYYSYDLPAGWHVVVLNSSCALAGGCKKGTPQEAWLRDDLAANRGKHILAIWHIPLFSSGGFRNATVYRTWWRDLYDAHAEIVLSGHDHDYERFARQSPTGEADPEGMRQFVVGTGGSSQDPFWATQPNSEVRQSGTYGVLKLTLRAHSYGWQFIPVAGGAFTDSGETATHLLSRASAPSAWATSIERPRLRAPC
jgi:hypothetical protein